MKQKLHIREFLTLFLVVLVDPEYKEIDQQKKKSADSHQYVDAQDGEGSLADCDCVLTPIVTYKKTVRNRFITELVREYE